MAGEFNIGKKIMEPTGECSTCSGEGTITRWFPKPRDVQCPICGGTGNIYHERHKLEYILGVIAQLLYIGMKYGVAIPVKEIAKKAKRSRSIKKDKPMKGESMRDFRKRMRARDTWQKS